MPFYGEKRDGWRGLIHQYLQYVMNSVQSYNPLHVVVLLEVIFIRKLSFCTVKVRDPMKTIPLFTVTIVYCK